MQFQSITAILAMVIAATAAPSSSTAPQCQANQTTSCCSETFTGLIPIGVTCNVLNVIGVLNPSCSPGQQLACCNSGTQSGNIIAVGTICAPISVS